MMTTGPQRFNTRIIPRNTINRQLIPIQDIPAADQLLKTISLIANRSIGLDGLPDNEPEFSPALPEELCFDIMQELRKIGLTQDDLHTDKGARQGALKRIMTIIQIKRYRAADLLPPTTYRIYQHCTKYSEDYPKDPYGELISLAINQEPIRILKTDTWHREKRNNGRNEEVIATIPALDHANTCHCLATYANNNMEYLTPMRMCCPQELFQENYVEANNLPTTRNMMLTDLQHCNPSNVYFSKVSKYGTVLPTLIRRQPVACITRQEIIQYKPQYAEFKLSRDKNLMAAVSAHMSKVDVTQFTQHFQETTRQQSDEGLLRFPHVTSLKRNMDVISYGSEIRNIEDIIINEPLVSPFYGEQLCPYCPEKLQIENATTFMIHLHREHQDLRYSNFTCPGCVLSDAHTEESYIEHYKEYHNQTEGLMLVLNETSVHSRTQKAMVLFQYLTMMREILQKVEKPDNNKKYISFHGAFTTGDPAEMLAEFTSLQHCSLPDDLRTGPPHPKSRKPMIPQPGTEQIKLENLPPNEYNRLREEAKRDLIRSRTQTDKDGFETPQPRRKRQENHARSASANWAERTPSPRLPSSFATTWHENDRRNTNSNIDDRYWNQDAYNNGSKH